MPPAFGLVLSSLNNCSLILRRYEEALNCPTVASSPMTAGSMAPVARTSSASPVPFPVVVSPATSQPIAALPGKPATLRSPRASLSPSGSLHRLATVSSSGGEQSDSGTGPSPSGGGDALLGSPLQSDATSALSGQPLPLPQQAPPFIQAARGFRYGGSFDSEDSSTTGTQTPAPYYQNSPRAAPEPADSSSSTPVSPSGTALTAEESSVVEPESKALGSGSAAASKGGSQAEDQAQAERGAGSTRDYVAQLLASMGTGHASRAAGLPPMDRRLERGEEISFAGGVPDHHRPNFGQTSRGHSAAGGGGSGGGAAASTSAGDASGTPAPAPAATEAQGTDPEADTKAYVAQLLGLGGAPGSAHGSPSKAQPASSSGPSPGKAGAGQHSSGGGGPSGQGHAGSGAAGKQGGTGNGSTRSYVAGLLAQMEAGETAVQTKRHVEELLERMRHEPEASSAATAAAAAARVAPGAVAALVHAETMDRRVSLEALHGPGTTSGKGSPLPGHVAHSSSSSTVESGNGGGEARRVVVGLLEQLQLEERAQLEAAGEAGHSRAQTPHVSAAGFAVWPRRWSSAPVGLERAAFQEAFQHFICWLTCQLVQLLQSQSSHGFAHKQPPFVPVSWLPFHHACIPDGPPCTLQAST